MQKFQSEDDNDVEGLFENLFLTGDFEINSIPIAAGNWKLLGVASIKGYPGRLAVTYSKEEGGTERSVLEVIFDSEIVYEIRRQSDTYSVR